MRREQQILIWVALALTQFALLETKATADEPALLKKHCAQCHNEEAAEGDFKLSEVGLHPNSENLQRWLDSLDRVSAGEMPPPEDVKLSDNEKETLVEFLKTELAKFKSDENGPTLIAPRRLNNREFENSVRDALLLEDVGTHLPTDDLIGDALHHGFDTHGETLGFSKFHLEQYIIAVRKIVNGTILSGEKPKSRRYEIKPDQIIAGKTSQNTSRQERTGNKEGFDFRDPRALAYFRNFKVVSETGRYQIKIRCSGLDRGLYDSEKTGIYDDDPIRLVVRMGHREKTFDLLDNEEMTIELDEWLASGTRLQLHYPTDGLRLRGNGNFKFQNAIAGEYVKASDPELYKELAASIKPKKNRRVRPINSWHHWVEYWRGPRPRIYDVEIEGPTFESWPPKHQVALIGRNPTSADAEIILKPIAERAWRRSIRKGELDDIVRLVQSKAKEIGEIEALKEGIVTILVSPQFLLFDQTNDSAEQRFSSKLSFFLQSTLPDEALRKSVADGKLNSFENVRAEIQRRFDESKIDPFLREFPFAWLELNNINFMAPDPDFFTHYHRKAISNDMIDEALQFFRHAMEENIPIPEFLSADYSFINADLAKVYGVKDVPQDSKLRKYTFDDQRRGGLLGMGAFLTSTADSLSTSPIHRAVYVMENFMGIHPTPPPPDIEITEPDVRQAKTIKEILNTHRSDPNCASCHQTIDPYGYAFENFDPAGAWRDDYSVMKADLPRSSRRKKEDATKIPIDASATFSNGIKYQDIVEYRKFLLTDANRDRFVRCFITKLLTYANGAEPAKRDFMEIEKILAKSAQNEYRIVDTIAAIVDSPLFRGKDN